MEIDRNGAKKWGGIKFHGVKEFLVGSFGSAMQDSRPHSARALLFFSTRTGIMGGVSRKRPGLFD